MGKTKLVMAGITATALTIGLSGCSSQAEVPPPPTDTDCDDWEWDDDDGVYECDDDHSRHYGHFFYGGTFYKGKNALLNSSAYKSYKSSSSFAGDSKNRSSGFGSGSSSSGG
ncbi:aminotransferase yhxA [Cytobacillus gottheilii]|uniref:aminotransferase yhxA n=1 Tax=Cytobacillus gottheilii TaxID=859144 RepID=UPI0009BAF806|nr:aminotransferase yhxA [Cytobacillus gottheilii]